MSGEDEQRLQKYLAERGIASRRESAGIIASGRVRVNGNVIREPGHRITPGVDRVELDGQPLADSREAVRTIALNKPRGYICSRSARQGRTVFELLTGVTERVVPVGRLDKESEGLLLLSNDGALTQRLTHPRYEHEKVYTVVVDGHVTAGTVARLNQPMDLDGYRTRPARVTPCKTSKTATRTQLEFRLKEGRNRQIRRMCDGVGLRIRHLIRTQIGGLSLIDLALEPGQWRDLSSTELAALTPRTQGGEAAMSDS